MKAKDNISLHAILKKILLCNDIFYDYLITFDTFLLKT